MIGPWIGLALLSASWLFGLDYYRDPTNSVWAALITGATLLLMGVPIRRPSPRQSALCAAVVLPAVVLAPWPYRAAIVLVFTGLLLIALPIPRHWPKALAGGAVVAGTILTAQSAAIVAYQQVTARSHELPRALAWVLCGISRLLGIQAGLDGTNLAVRTPRVVHRLGATWELLLDPPTFCFIVGGIVLLCLAGPTSETGAKSRRIRFPQVALLVIPIALWLPIRAGLLISVLLHRALRVGYDAPLALMNQFWNPWVHAALLAGPILMAVRFVKLRTAALPDIASPPASLLRERLTVPLLVFVGSVLLLTSLLMDPPGKRKPGRLFVDEHHSQWERTDRPFDPNWYGHDSGYNYACIYDYCSHFYDTSRLMSRIDDSVLKNCDVLMVKVPTERYGADEIAAIRRFVKRGGGLVLVGEHTNVFNTGVCINEIAEEFGLRFRYDCLFEIDTVFEQRVRPGLVPHPIVQNMGPMNLAVSCSIDPGFSRGRAVICSTGLRNLPADYHASNYYPQVEDRAVARYGAFVQVWARRFGRGRVVAFSDSTIYSNFAAFEPGKPELLLGMLEWANYRNALLDVRPLLFIAGGIVLVVVAAKIKTRPTPWLLLFAAGTLGWAVSVVGASAVHRWSMPPPRPQRPFVNVVMDRTVCNTILPTSGFIAGRKNGFGIFERWTLRLGYFTSRRSGNDAFGGDVLIFTDPNQPVPSQFRQGLIDYVDKGGRVLVLDSPANAQSSANSLLYPFGLKSTPDPQLKGSLQSPPGWPTIQIDSTCRIEGGEPILSVQGTPIAAEVKYGQGTVTVIGFSSRFADAYMGITGDVVPDAALRQVFELQFTLLRTIVSSD